MKHRDFAKSIAAVSGGMLTGIHKSAAQREAERVAAGKLWRIVLTERRAVLAPLLLGLLLASWAAMAQAQSTESAKSTAAASAGGPIAKIRLLREGHVGDTLTLESIGKNASETHFDWRFQRRPSLSEAILFQDHLAKTSFRADVPGLYVVELTVKFRGASATATLGITATEPGPLIPVNTIDTSQGIPAMVVGSQRYANTNNLNGTNGNGLHMLALDRNTLEYKYDYYEPLTSAGIAAMTNNMTGVAQRPGFYLFFVSLPASAGPIPSDLIAPLNQALNLVGGLLPPKWDLKNPPPTQCWSSNTPDCAGDQWSNQGYITTGSFSVIGVSAMAVGKAWYDDATQRKTTNGALVGYLTRGETVGGGTYPHPYTFVFSSDQYVLVDSCASGGPDACVIQVGSQTFEPQAGVNGVHVVVLDRVTLRPLTHQTVTSTQALFSAIGGAASQVGHSVIVTYDGVLGFLKDRVVVVIQSVGTGALTYDYASPLLQVIDNLGGTPETFGKAITKGLPYALIGVMSNLPWHGKGIESSPVMVLGQSSNTITPFRGDARGVLARDRMARYTPAANDPVGNANLDLAPIVYQNPTPWPYAGSCSVTYIAVQLGLATVNQDGSVSGYTDIRSRYYEVPNNNWNDQDPLNVP